jgi:DNA-binding HxlR family transcriptional regulator
MAKFNKAQSNPKDNPVSYVMNVMGGKWKPIIIWAIHSKHNRFGEMQRQIPDITKKMLTNQLRELEADGIINRKVFPVVPPKVEYSITKKGMLLGPLLILMCEVGEKLKKAK